MNKFNESKIYYHALQTKMGKLFLCTLAGFAILFVGYLIYAGCTLRNSQVEIKNCYAEHIKKADTLYYNLSAYNKDALAEVQKTNDALLADSLIRLALCDSRNLSKEQVEKLEKILIMHFDKMENLHDKYGEKLTRDSLRLATERELLEGQTKNMIDLHLSKIEHEYSNITLWCAVMTILFLVFNFYSLYKIDDLIDQGKEGVKDIQKLKKEGEITRRKHEADLKRFVEEQTEILKQTITKIESTGSNIESRYNAEIIKLESAIKSKIQEFDKIIADAKTLLIQQNEGLGNSNTNQTKEEEV